MASIVAWESFPTRSPELSNVSRSAINQKHSIEYSDVIKGIHISIVYFIGYHTYLVEFRKSDQIYTPIETPFAANTWEMLHQQIEIEMRTEALSNFVGVVNRRKILDAISDQGSALFLQSS